MEVSIYPCCKIKKKKRKTMKEIEMTLWRQRVVFYLQHLMMNSNMKWYMTVVPRYSMTCDQAEKNVANSFSFVFFYELIRINKIQTNRYNLNYNQNARFLDLILGFYFAFITSVSKQKCL